MSSRPECAALTGVIPVSIRSNKTARRVEKDILNYAGGRRITARWCGQSRTSRHQLEVYVQKAPLRGLWGRGWGDRFLIFDSGWLHSCRDLRIPVSTCMWCNKPQLGSKNIVLFISTYKGADKSLARPWRKQATATEDFDFHISYL